MLVRKYFVAVLVGSLIGAASIAPAFAGSYGALSAGFWKDENGALHVSAGTAKNFSSPRRAADAANDACFEEGRNCHVVSTFSNGGCGFISVGHNAQSTRYGTGSTARKAFDNCSVDGFDCNPPKGGCTSYDD
jgi:hypothetical protein